VADGIHLSAISPCRGAGNPIYEGGTDIDGEPWLNPPSIGCDEYYAADFTGPLLVGPITAWNAWGGASVLRNAGAWISSTVAGNADRILWSFGDGTVLSNSFIFMPLHTWTNAGDFNVTFTAYNSDNLSGISTNTVVHVALPDAPLLSTSELNRTNVVLSFPTQGGITYTVEQTTNLAPPIAWQNITSIFGIGSPAYLTNDTKTNPAAFFHVRVQ
jgi:hypothetical protein